MSPLAGLMLYQVEILPLENNKLAHTESESC